MTDLERRINVYRQDKEATEGGLEIGPCHTEVFPCEPDEFDLAEGTTAVDLALEVLNLKIYAEEASSYPDWQRGTWYSRTEHGYGDDYTDVSAHLVNFSDAEALEICRRFTSR